MKNYDISFVLTAHHDDTCSWKNQSNWWNHGFGIRKNVFVGSKFGSNSYGCTNDECKRFGKVWTIFQPLKELQLATPSHATQATISFWQDCQENIWIGRTTIFCSWPTCANNIPPWNLNHGKNNFSHSFAAGDFLKKNWFQESDVWTCPNL